MLRSLIAAKVKFTRVAETAGDVAPDRASIGRIDREGEARGLGIVLVQKRGQGTQTLAGNAFSLLSGFKHDGAQENGDPVS